LHPFLQRKNTVCFYRLQIYSQRRRQQLYVVNKRPQIELCALLTIRIPIANSLTRWCCNFKGLSQNGGRADFIRNPRASLFNETFRMSIILAGSISLDRTFNINCSKSKIVFLVFHATSAFVDPDPLFECRFGATY
jgi:hypothetical protein